MYVIDITRCHDDLGSDVLVFKDSMDGKRKAINYVKDYAFANYNIYLNNDLLDQSINLDGFSFKDFMKNNYNINVHSDLMIQGFHTEKDNLLFVKFYDDDKKEYPTIYSFSNEDKNTANSVLTYLVNDALIKKYMGEESLYQRYRLDYDNNLFNYSHDNIKCETISLNNKGLLLEDYGGISL